MMDYTIRFATLDDVVQIVTHRRLMFTDMGGFTLEAITAVEIAYHDWLLTHMKNQEYVGVLAQAVDLSILGGAGLWLYEHIPSPLNPGGRGAHIVDVYVRPDARRQGFARELTVTLLDWCRENGYDQVTLTPSAEGKPLYQELGFTMMNRMIIDLSKQS